MSPIDRELERALDDRAADQLPSGDLLAGVEREARSIRRRRGALTGAAALSVLAIAVAVPLATRDAGDADPGVGFATQAPSPSASPTPATTATPPSEPALGWRRRGSLGEDVGLPSRIQETLNQETDLPLGHAWSLLWAAPLPDGRVAAAIEHWSTPAYAMFYVEEADGANGRLVQRLEVTNPRAWQVSAYVDGDQDFVVVVGAPTTGQLEFSTDGRRYTTVETVEGVGIVAVTKGEDRAAYKVRVYDGNGVVVYDGPIDLLSDD